MFTCSPVFRFMCTAQPLLTFIPVPCLHITLLSGSLMFHLCIYSFPLPVLFLFQSVIITLFFLHIFTLPLCFYSSSLPSLTTLPGLWLRTLLFDLLQHGPESRLCATRRSAGLPFYVQAIISTETHTGDTLSSTMEQLLPVAMRRCEMDDPETDTTVS